MELQNSQKDFPRSGALEGDNKFSLKPVEFEISERTTFILNLVLFRMFPKKLNSSFRSESDIKKSQSPKPPKSTTIHYVGV